MGMQSTKIDLMALADDASNRSVRGIVMLILNDTVTGVNLYNRVRNIKETYTAENKAIISKCFIKYGVKKIKVVCYNKTESETIEDALKKLDMVKFNYLACPTATEGSDKKLIGDFIIEQRKADNILTHAVLNNYVGDNEGIIDFANTSIKLGTETLTGASYCVDVACMCATGAINKSLTNKVAEGVTECDEITDKDEAVEDGKLFLFYDNDLEAYLFSRAVNSKTTIGTNEKEDLKKIRIVEILDMIRDDLKLEWKVNYQAKKDNSYDDRLNLCTRFNTYFSTLARKGLLNNSVDYMSKAYIDLEATKDYLEDRGVDISEMTDSQILTYDMKDKVFIKARVYVLDVMEDLQMQLQF